MIEAKTFTLRPGERLVLAVECEELDGPALFFSESLSPARVLLALPCGGELFTRLYQETRPGVDFDEPVLSQLRGYFFCPLHCDKATDCPRFKDYVERLEKDESPVLADLWVKHAEAGHAEGDESDVAYLHNEIPDKAHPAGYFARARRPGTNPRTRPLVERLLDKVRDPEKYAEKRCCRKKEVDDGLRFHGAAIVAEAAMERKDGGEDAGEQDEEGGAE